MKPLNESSIRAHIPSSELNQRLIIDVFSTIDSTNRYLKEKQSNDKINICCAETQTHGRGRFGRSWHSPFGENIYCSVKWALNCDISRLSGLSLVSSLAVIDTLRALNINSDIMIKWPNDVLWNQSKLAGSLIELNIEPSCSPEVIIGIGLNVNSETKHHPLQDKAWCSLLDMTGKIYDRNIIISQLITSLLRHIEQMIAHDFSYFLPQWNKVDYLFGRHTTVQYANGKITGKVMGVDPTGQLILNDNNGNTHFLSSGETSLHAN